MLRKFIVICLALLLGSVGSMVATPHLQVNAASMKLYVDPSPIINQTMLPNTLFNISVKLDNIPADPGAVGIQFVLTWNSSVLNGVSMQEVIFHETMPADKLDNLNRVAQKVTVANASYAYTYYDIPLAISDGYAPINGSHTVAIITMKVVGTGKTALHFSDSVVGDQNANDIPHDNIDGFFSNLPPPPPALLYVDPPKISNLSLTPGSDFTVNVSIADASGVYGLEFELGFNTSIVTANSVSRGDFIPPSATILTQIDNVSGFVKFNASLSSSLDGDGVLAEISFHVEALGGTPLHLYGIQLIDSFGLSLPWTSSDGSFDNVLLAKLAIDPPIIIDPTLVPPATFTINVTIADVRGLYGYQFNLTFDPSILICLQDQIHDVLNETHYVPNENIVDNVKGFVFINVSYYSPAVPLDIDSALPLVTIKFRVKAMGSSNLTLTDTGLVDNLGQPIVHVVFNGFFQSLIVDIAVVDVSAAPTSVAKGKSTNVTVVVLNEGDIAESFVVNVYFNATLMASLNVTNLAAKANETMTVEVSTGAIIWGKYVVKAEVPALPFETHTADNTFIDGIVKVKIPGDLNDDDIVNILDAIVMSYAFGSTPSSPNWNPDADLNGDGVVNIIDAILMGINFGAKI